MSQRELTQEEIDQFPHYIQKWKTIATCTDPIDKPNAIKAMKQIYKGAHKTRPKNFIFTGSPHANAMVAQVCHLLIEHGEIDTTSALLDAYPESIENQQERDRFLAGVTQVLQEQCYPILIKAGQLKHGSTQLNTLVKKSLVALSQESFDNEMKQHLQNSGFGNMDAGWLSYYNFFQEVVGLEKETAELAGLFEFATHAGWFLPFVDTVFIADRPSFISLDSENRFHCTTRAALEFRDGFKLYCLHDIKVEWQLIVSPETLTLKRIEEERNAEIRRVLINELYGTDKYIIDSDATVLDVDTDMYGRQRRLLRVEVPGDESIVRVQVINSSPELDQTYRTYFLPVEPSLRPIISVEPRVLGEPQKMTCHNAVASTFGLRGEEYNPDVES